MAKRTERPFRVGDLITPIMPTVTALNRAVKAVTEEVFKVICVRLCRKKGWIVYVQGRLKFLAGQFRKVTEAVRRSRAERNWVYRLTHA